MDDLDHRKLGPQLHLYHIQENAPGMVFWHPNGYEIYRVLEDYIRRKMRSLSFKEIRTPQLLPRELWEKSGHWDKFRQNMFTVQDADGADFALKPMSCPCHLQIFNQGRRSYRELPVRYSEFGACHRNESSGSMHGLMRTRAFEQDDAHVICREEHVFNEVRRFVMLLDQVYKELGFADYRVALSTRPAVRFGSDELWDWAEKQLGDAAGNLGISFDLQPGEGAFYGPKLEFALRDRQGRDWQCGTIQLDFVLPGRLDAVYRDESDAERTPLMIHHAVFGSMGRFIAMLLEHHGGRLPFWLAPEQVAVLSVSDKQSDYAQRVADHLNSSGFRAVVYNGNDTVSRKLVDVHASCIPYSVIVGRREVEDETVTLRSSDGDQRVIAFPDLADAMKSL